MGDAADDAQRRAEREVEEEAIDVEAIEEASETVRSADLVIREEREHTPAPASVLPSPKEWEATLAVAKEIAATQFVPESYRGRPESVVAAILTGREMGIGPMQSLRQIHMIDGRPAFAADLMMAKMRQGGVVVLDSSVNDERAYILARRKDTGEEAMIEWRYEEATKIMRKGKPLSDGVNWRNYRHDMLWARAVGRLARRFGSDLLGGLLYAKEEIEDWGDDDGGYGGASGYEATTERPFDPETDLMEGAISGENARVRIATELKQLDPTIDWGLLLEEVKPGWRDLQGNDANDFWRRLSNAECWMRQAAGPGDFPPVETDIVVAGIAYAFSGLQVDVPYQEAAPIPPAVAAQIDEAGVEDIPFGYENE